MKQGITFLLSDSQASLKTLEIPLFIPDRQHSSRKTYASQTALVCGLVQFVLLFVFKENFLPLYKSHPRQART